jgi:hypothetical protein
MSFSGLSNLFEGKGSRRNLAFLLSLKSPESAKGYLLEIHKRVFPNADSYERIAKRWQSYPSASIARSVKPVLESDLANPEFTNKLAEKLSFDISRFTDFIEGYARVAEDIKPVMLHYAMIYLLDFYSRTWLRHGQNMSHGVKMIPQEGRQTVLDAKVKLLENGIFPRAVDAFFVTYQSSLFSNDDNDGVGYYVNPLGGTMPERFPKLQYCKTPQVKLGELLDFYKRLGHLEQERVHTTVANKILTGYLILFSTSFISRYKAKDWFRIREDRNLGNRIELLNHDFVSDWIPELILQTSLM